MYFITRRYSVYIINKIDRSYYNKYSVEITNNFDKYIYIYNHKSISESYSLTRYFSLSFFNFLYNCSA